MGHLIYLTIIRPDIAYVVSIVSHFMRAPTIVHLDVVHRILRYLKHNLGVSLLYSRRSDLLIEGYTNADWVDSLTDCCLTSGYCTFVGGNLVTCEARNNLLLPILVLKLSSIRWLTVFVNFYGYVFSLSLVFLSLLLCASTMIIRLSLALLIIRYSMIAPNISKLIVNLSEKNSLPTSFVYRLYRLRINLRISSQRVLVLICL